MTTWLRSRWLSGFIVLAGAVSIQAAEFHVTPGGSPKGNGSVAEPWDLSTALVATRGRTHGTAGDAALVCLVTGQLDRVVVRERRSSPLASVAVPLVHVQNRTVVRRHARHTPPAQRPATGFHLGPHRTGVSKSVYSDDRGKFVLSWKSSGGLAKLYANGSVVATDIRDGESVVVTVK